MNCQFAIVVCFRWFEQTPSRWDGPPVSVEGAMSREIAELSGDEREERPLRIAPCLLDPAWGARHLSEELENDLRERGIHIGGDGSVLTRDQYVFDIGDLCWGRIWRIHHWERFTALGKVHWIACFYRGRSAGARDLIHADLGPAAFAVRTLQRAFRARVRRRWDRVVADALAIASCYVEGRKGGFVRKSKIN